MFTWDTTQPIPFRLRELLDRAGAVQVTGNQTLDADVHIFLPLDLILSCGSLSLDAISRSYLMLLISLRMKRLLVKRAYFLMVQGFLSSATGCRNGSLVF